MEKLGAKMILGNTYHLGHRPGSSLISGNGSLHKFMGWPNNLLTDSGGFQMVSLCKLSTITEEGVRFNHPTTGGTMLLSPERSVEIQKGIGADVMMALDDVVDAVEPSKERVEEAVYRTARWLDRCLSVHKDRDRQHLWGIVQGGLHIDLRTLSLELLKERNLPGYAIGGLSGGEAKEDFCAMVELVSRMIEIQIFSVHSEYSRRLRFA